MEIAILFALILLNGVFAMSEIALVTARKARMQKFIDEGDHGAAVAIELGKEPTRFLSTVQIGITSISVLNGIVGESVLAKPLDLWLRSLGMDPKWSEYGATGLVVVTITYFSIVLGELVPKRLGQQNPELVARMVSRPIQWLSIATRPFVKLLAGSTDLVLTALGAKNNSAPGVTQEEIHAMLSEGTDSGAIEHHEHTMVRNVFRLDDRQLGSLMVPRADIVALDANAPWEENQRRIEEGDHTRFPVVASGMHEILGVVTARILLGKKLRGETPDLRTGLQPPVFVPESLTGMELLENFRSSGVQLAFVVDEYGEVLGMVTLKDVMEAITGEFKPRNVEDSWAIQREDGSWLLDGLIPIPELKDRLSLKSVPEEDRERYHTLSGLMMLLLGRLPQTADSITWENWKLEVVDIDGKRIDKVLATKMNETLDTAALQTEA
ncbi:MAG: HlyC/CorC family transporter [Betaproteobacteria bacterium]|nr:HlyC/CorC family transporter [Betaproteobacteria bacterium]